MSDTASEKTAVVLHGVTGFYNPIERLDAMKAAESDFRATVLVCPGIMEEEALEELCSRDWLEVGVDGYHGASFECATWSDEEADMKISELEAQWPGARVFRASNWATCEAVEKRLEAGGWVSVCSGISIGSWGDSAPPRFVYNCADVTSVCAGAATGDWETSCSENMDYRFVSEEAGEVVTDMMQELHNSWTSDPDKKYSEAARSHMVQFLREINPRGIVADFGGNDGYAAKIANDAGYLVEVVDNSISRIAFAREVHKVPARRQNLEAMDLSDNTYEWGYCSHTLEHLEDLDKAWEEIRRVTRNGCFVVVPLQTETEFKNDESHHQWKTEEEWLEFCGGVKIEPPEELALDDELIMMCRWDKT